MIKKEDFSPIYSPLVIDNIIKNNPVQYYHSSAYRIIKHSKDEVKSEKDFYPYIMEKNKKKPYEMPDYSDQDRKTSFEQFAVSCYDTREHLEQYIESVTSLRENFINNKWYIAKGFVNKELGFADKVDESSSNLGHFNYYLYNPLENNPVCDFEDGEVESDD